MPATSLNESFDRMGLRTTDLEEFPIFKGLISLRVADFIDAVTSSLGHPVPQDAAAIFLGLCENIAGMTRPDQEKVAPWNRAIRARPGSETWSFDQVERELSDLGLPQVDPNLDTDFYLMVGGQVGRLVREIESLMGGNMPEHARSVLYVTAEKVAQSALCDKKQDLEVPTF